MARQPFEHCSTLELECEELKVSHEVTHARNNASAFTLRASLSTTNDARSDNQGSALYWTRKADCAASYLHTLRSEIARRNAQPGI